METYSSEKINSILNYSKMLVDSMSDGCRDELTRYKYLIFAGMILYYGRENIQVIYDAFLKTDLVLVDEKLINFFDRCFDFSADVMNEVSALRPQAYLSPKEISGRRNIYVSKTGDHSEVGIIYSLIQEYNKVINSINTSSSFKNRYVTGRRGIRYVDSSDGQVKNGILEETINAFQTEEIMREVLGFYHYDIGDDELKCMIQSIAFKSDDRDFKSGFEMTMPLVKPLYVDDKFRQLLKEARFNGDVAAIEDLFNSKTQDGGFKKFSMALDSIGIGECPDYVLEINAGITQELVKQYSKHL